MNQTKTSLADLAAKVDGMIVLDNKHKYRLKCGKSAIHLAKSLKDTKKLRIIIFAKLIYILLLYFCSNGGLRGRQGEINGRVTDHGASNCSKSGDFDAEMYCDVGVALRYFTSCTLAMR